MVTPVNSLIADVLNYQYNPASIQSAILQKLTDATNGTLEIVDPTNPFVFCLEAASVLTAANMVKNEVNTRKQYPVSAQTNEDLYLHMSDKDYANRFAIPSTTKFSILLPLDEVLNKMVLDPITNIKKLVIPRNSFFTVINTNFSIQYPIEIRQLAHGGIQVVYDASIVSPLQTLTTNVIQHEIRQSIEGKYIYFDFDVQQFDIISQTGMLNAATDFSLTTTLTDNFYYARVYAESFNGSWKEIKTTHTDQIYDVNAPTAVIKVIDKIVTVSIPQIYITTGLLTNGIRIDLYQTKGALDLILYEYPFSSFVATWQAYDTLDLNEFVAPLNTFNTIIPFSTGVVSGGSNGITFDNLRIQVINNAIGAPSLPITSAQITTALSLNGYSIVKHVDNVTDRVFLATKGLPTPKDISLITPAAATIATVQVAISDLVQINSVIDNGSSVTITPDTIYQDINGIVRPLTTSQLHSLLAQPVNTLALTVTQGNYLYTPFHYVLDTSNNVFSVRPYYLDNPDVVTKLFVSENDTTLIPVNTGTYSIYKTASGYAITIITQSTAAYKALSDDQVQVQLSFIPNGEKDYAFLIGQLAGKTVDNERIFTFDIATNFNVDNTDHLSLTKFLMYNTQPRITKASLVTDFNIIYTTTAPMDTQWSASAIDNKLGNFLLPSRVVGITQEVLRVRFGYALTTLWSRARSVVSTIPYKTYDVSVPRLYDQDVYARDSSGSAITIDGTGNPIMNLLHSKGDPVLDADGQQTYLHLAGDVIKDSNGNPIPSDNRGMLRQISIMLIEGAYWFANDLAASNYRTTITQDIVSWLTNDLVNIGKQILEQTRVYFYPNTTLGTIRALVDNGVVKNIKAGQSFKVVLSVSNLVYNNIDLRAKISGITIKTINSQLSNATVSLDSIITALRASYGDDVISFQVSGLGGVNNYSIITPMDESQRCSIQKRLTALSNNNLIVEEDVTCDFVKYQLPAA